MDRNRRIASLRRHLRAAVRARFSERPLAERSRAIAFADGYMRALLDEGIVSRAELLTMLAEERELQAPRMGSLPLEPEAA